MGYNPNAALKESDIVYEDNHLIAVNKKPGQISQGDQTGDITLVDQVKTFCAKSIISQEIFSVA